MATWLKNRQRLGLRWVTGTGLAAVAVACASTVAAGLAADHGNDRPVVAPAADMRWASVEPQGVQQSPLWGNGQEPSQGTLQRLKAGMTAGPFRESGETIGVVIGGTVTLRTPAPYASAPLGPGSWFRIPPGSAYSVQAQTGREAVLGLIQVEPGDAGALTELTHTAAKPALPTAIPAKAVQVRTVEAGDLAMTGLWGNRQRTASCALVRQPAGKLALMRSYPADTHLIIVTGSAAVLLEGQKPSKPLGPGSYMAIPAGAPYLTRAAKDQNCLMLEYHPGPVDAPTR
ncbi:MAG: cupin domain-containing protein [Candidatus Sericytochromatia bacterium]|nr:cupin domain-containing protein [Candidatus Sericytochromatia bacterium]